MKRSIRIVAPFRPCPLEADVQQVTANFDWTAAIQMMAHSATLACCCPVHVITDLETDLPVETLRYPTTHRRLMLWTLEACASYLESDDFDRDTVMLDCDQLIFDDLEPFFANNVDLGLLIRPTHRHKETWKKLLNGVQFWHVRGKPRLAEFYRQALARAEAMNDDLIRWGADTAAIREMIEPFDLGRHDRSGLSVHLMDYNRVLAALSEEQILGMSKGVAPIAWRPVLDFRYGRKRFMAQAYAMTIGATGVSTEVKCA